MKEPHELWHHEDTLINHRLTWLLTSQSLIFVAYGWALNSENGIKITKTIIKVGLFTSSLIFIGLLAAILAQIVLRKKYGKLYVWFPATVIGWITSIGISLSFLYGWICLY